MSGIAELIRTESDGSISFGNYELNEKSKKSDFPHQGDLYKVKTFCEITKLERNDMFVYESVPGTVVTSLNYFDDGIGFTAEGIRDTQITVEGEPDTEYEICVDGKSIGTEKTSLGGKLSFSVDLSDGKKAEIRIYQK